MYHSKKPHLNMIVFWETMILFYIIHCHNYIHNVRGVYFNAMLYFIQHQRQRTTLSRGLQRIFTSNHVGRYYINSRKGNYVTSMTRPIIQTKGLLLLVTKTSSTQIFRLLSLAPMLYIIINRTLKYPLVRWDKEALYH